MSSATSLHLESSPSFLLIYSNNDKAGSWIIYKKTNIKYCKIIVYTTLK